MKKTLIAGLAQLGLDFSATQINQLLDYGRLLQRWNKIVNLTAITDPREIAIKHFLDSLAIANHVSGERLLDVGSGAGFPGIPLAIANPSCSMVLLDSAQKKSRFCRQVIAELKLDNCTVIATRLEDFSPVERFDVVLSRAFSATDILWEKSRHLLARNGRLCAMKASLEDEEKIQLFGVEREIHPITVPFLAARRCLVIIRNNQ